MGLVKRTYVDGETVITADNLNDIQDEIIQNALDISTKGTYSKPSGGIPSTDMTTAVQTSLGKADTAYQKPSGGIPSTDLASGVQTSLGKADTAYQKPSGGIPSTDLASAVQTSLGKADTALQSSDIDSTLTVSGKAADAKKTGDEISGVKNTLNQLTRPNLLDNWYFVGGGSQQGDGNFPINQRGYSSYNNVGYTIDRWYLLNGGTVDISGGAMNLTVSTLYAALEQRIKTLLFDQPYTLTAFVGNDLVSWTFSVSSTSSNPFMMDFYNGTYVTVLYSSGCWHIYLFDNSTSSPITVSNIKAVKLELGSGKTLAHQENGVWVLNEIPDYEEQLIRCKTSTADPSDTYAFNSITYNAPRPNLLDNWYFVYGKAINNDYSSNGTFPVNQRGQQSYSGAGYTCDRWRLSDADMLCYINSDGIGVEDLNSSHTDWSILTQIIEKPENLIGKTVTVSLLSWASTLSNFSLALRYSSGGSPTFVEKVIDDYFVSFTTTIPSGINSLSVVIRKKVSTSASIKLHAVKLEVGSGQTLAHQENGQWVLNEIPNYGEELAKCQRYLRQSFVSSPTEEGWCACVAGSVTSFPAVNWSTPMASTPNITFYGKDGTLSAVTDWATDVNITGVNPAYASANGFGAQKINAFTTGKVYFFHYRASAEL